MGRRGEREPQELLWNACKRPGVWRSRGERERERRGLLSKVTPRFYAHQGAAHQLHLAKPVQYSLTAKNSCSGPPITQTSIFPDIQKRRFRCPVNHSTSLILCMPNVTLHDYPSCYVGLVITPQASCQPLLSFYRTRQTCSSLKTPFANTAWQ